MTKESFDIGLDVGYLPSTLVWDHHARSSNTGQLGHFLRRHMRIYSQLEVAEEEKYQQDYMYSLQLFLMDSKNYFLEKNIILGD